MSNSTTNGKPTVQIKISPAARDRMKALKAVRDPDGSWATFMDLFLEQGSGSGSFTDEAFAKISEAAAISGMSTESIAAIGALKYAETLLRAKKRNRTAPTTKIHALVAATMTANEEAANWWDKIEITKGWIANTTGMNRKTINQYVESNKDALNVHHTKCEIEHDHNRKVYNYTRTLKNVPANGEDA